MVLLCLSDIYFFLPGDLLIFKPFKSRVIAKMEVSSFKCFFPHMMVAGGKKLETATMPLSKCKLNQRQLDLV